MLTRKQIARAYKSQGQYAPTDNNISSIKINRLDTDIKTMSLVQLRKEVMKLRTALRKELADNGNQRCWITLLKATARRKSS